jgi:8-oxo-dGTP diphosphatase
VRRRVIAYVTRTRDGRKELLVFDHRDHPKAGTQVPAGRLDDGESLEEGLKRELYEESGLERVRVVRELTLPDDLGHGHRYENHAFEVEVEGDAPERWEHTVLGDGDDSGLVFVYRWEPVTRELELFGRRDPVVAQLLRER